MDYTQIALPQGSDLCKDTEQYYPHEIYVYQLMT